MSEMVERVAAAIWTDEMAKNLGWEAPFSELPPPQQAILRRAARAAIEAMREPTEAMIQRSYLCDSLDAKEKWQAMIDEALR